MQHEYDPALLADEPAAAIARRAAGELDYQSDGTAIPARAYWRLPTVGPVLGPKPVVEAVIRDETPVELTLRLNAHELSDNDLRYRMIRWWGDVLEARSNVLMARRLAAVGADYQAAEVA